MQTIYDQQLNPMLSSSFNSVVQNTECKVDILPEILTPGNVDPVFRSKTDVVTTEVGYNYGVPSSKPKLSTAKRSANQSAETKIRVCVRKRPLSVTDSLEGELDIVEVLGADTITVCAPKVAVDLTKYTQKVSQPFP